MTALLKKEIKLSASPLSFIFLAFTLMTFIPNYPILLSGFFICFGVFQSFQTAREASDITFTTMLPVSKSDVVKAKFVFTCFIQLTGFVLLVVFTLIRMFFMKTLGVYTANSLMNANPALDGYYLIVCSAFNCFFLRSFWKTAYKIGIPFLHFCIAAFFIIIAAEALHFFPAMTELNSTFFKTIQLVPLVLGIILYIGTTAVCLKLSINSFEKIDL